MDKVYEFDQKKDDKKPTFNKCNELNLIYDTDHSFYTYNYKRFGKLSLNLKFFFPVDFFNVLVEFSKLENQEEKKRKKRQLCVI